MTSCVSTDSASGTMLQETFPLARRSIIHHLLFRQTPIPCNVVNGRQHLRSQTQTFRRGTSGRGAYLITATINHRIVLEVADYARSRCFQNVAYYEVRTPVSAYQSPPMISAVRLLVPGNSEGCFPCMHLLRVPNSRKREKLIILPRRA
ncbi:hypothetical protein CC2G_003397 [Coprinopsis cinerea AmutBmut pab1-1]|nr:hypothetical protein CC2G_003397 [Coprinopsis cinerea AmutBmut pab1-1]